MTNKSYDFYIELLSARFYERQKFNPQYSFRAFSRDLKFDSSSLRKILQKKRPFPLNASERVSQKLKFSKDEYSHFIESITTQSRLGVFPSYEKIPAFKLEDHFYKNIICEWEYFAVLNLFYLDEFYFDDLWISGRLGISSQRATKVINHLIQSKLVVFKNGSWQRSKKRLDTTDMISSKELRASHLQELELAKKAIETVPLEEFDCFSMVFPTNVKKLNQARRLIRDFFLKMEDILEKDEKSEVYQMSLQLYPLSKKKTKTIPNNLQ